MGNLILRSSRSFVPAWVANHLATLFIIRPFFMTPIHFILHTKKQTLPMLTPSMFKASFPERHPVQNVACEQALRGALATGWEKEREPATTSLEFEY